MRDIKFRAWRIKSELMQFNVQNVIPTVLDPGGSFSDYIQSDDVILMQYTGLKDIRGAEIYEGDRVKYVEHNDFYFDSKPENLETVVEIDINPFKDEICGGPDGRIWYTDIEVIGNIHENPELLGEVK